MRAAVISVLLKDGTQNIDDVTERPMPCNKKSLEIGIL